MYGFPILVGGRGALPSILLFHLCKKILNNELVSDYFLISSYSGSGASEPHSEPEEDDPPDC